MQPFSSARRPCARQSAVERAAVAAQLPCGRRTTMNPHWSAAYLPLRQISVGSLFVANGRGLIMARQNLDVFREGQDFLLQCPDEFGLVAARQVAAPDFMAEKAIAAKEHFFCLTVETNAAGRMSGRFNDTQLVATETDLATVAESVPH